jgi:hypothetical protein
MPILQDWTFFYSGIHLNEINHSPLLACGEGVGGGVLISRILPFKNDYFITHHWTTGN